MWVLGWVLLLISLGLLAVLLAWSRPGTPAPVLDAEGRPIAGSIAEKTRVGINGRDQGMILKARDPAAPVLLYLHGGMPEYFLTQRYPTGLEDLFVVCWWEQRGAGLSFDPARAREPVTLEQLIADTVEVTNYLRRRFGRDRIYLMGHSGGTFLGTHVVARAPELYHAYIGVSQMSNQLRSEARTYEYMLGEYRRMGADRMVRRLQSAPVTMRDGVPDRYLAVRDTAMHRLGVGTMHDMRSFITGIFLESLRSRDYTLGEKLSLWRGKASSGVSSMWKEILATDLAERVPAVRVPVYFLHGLYDCTCSREEALHYFDRLEAPLKGFYTFAHSAHSPMFEEPARVREIMRLDVLAGTNRLADGR